MYAAFGGQPHVVQLLIKHKADLDSINKSGSTALMKAS